MQNIFIDVLPPWVETGLQPAFYDLESGTVLQQTARMYAKVRELNEAFNTFSTNVTNEINQFEEDTNDEIERFEGVVNDTVEEYIEKFNDLHDYVEDYFENLDVQEEINNKLDDMLEDGTLQEIITTYIQSNVAWTFDTVADMQAATNLIEGSYARTLGYYTINDQGGGLYKVIAHDSETIDGGKYIELSETLTAELIVIDNEVNAKQFGAKGDGVTDDTTELQNALSSGYNVYLPTGTYLVSETLNMPFNIKLRGYNRINTIIDSTIESDYTIKYGSSYNYNSYSGVIENIRIESSNPTSTKPFGIYMNSGLTIKNCTFYSIGKAIDRSSSYIDMINISNVYVGYCVPNNNYIINLAGNSDALVISQLKFEAYTDDSTQKNGLFISTCHGGSINDSIINGNITFDRVSGFSMNNTHTEGLDRTYYIVSSVVTFNNIFKWKNSTGNDIVITTPDNYKNITVTLKNFVFARNGSNYGENITPEISTLPYNTTVILENVYRYINLADIDNFTDFLFGIAIDGYTDFNINSGKYSKHSIITKTNIMTDFSVNSIGTATANLGTITKFNKLKWLDSDYATLHYRAVVIVDEGRKIICGYSGDANISSLVTNGDCVLLPINNDSVNRDVYLYRGETLNHYTKRVKVSLTYSRTRVYDTGIKCAMEPWETVEDTDALTGYLNTMRFEKNGENVTVWANTTPSAGTWKRFDKVINTSHTTGQAIAWEYDGTNWIAQGSY